MKAISFLLIAFVSMQGIASVRADTSEAPNDPIVSLVGDLKKGSVSTIEIMFIPDNIIFNKDVRPDEMRYVACVKKKYPLTNDHRLSLVKALETAKFTRTDESPDVRWGMISYDGEGHEIHSVFLSHRYTNTTENWVVVDRNSLKTDYTLLSWFEENFERTLKAAGCERNGGPIELKE